MTLESLSTAPSMTSGRSPDALFQPFRLRNLLLRNRIVMPPMTRCFSPGGVPGEDVAAYYARRARNDVGLIFTEGTWIPHAGASNDPNVPDFFGEAALAGWRRVADAVHAEGGAIIPQLWHIGLQLKPRIENLYAEGDFLRPDLVGPSGMVGGIGIPLERRAEPMSQADIDAVIEAYAASAAHAYQLGFDGVALHGAHGYLIDQFFWTETNLRADLYGGDIAGRARFGAEIVAEMRRRTSPYFPIVFRFSQWKAHDYGARLAYDPSALEKVLVPLAEAGVDLFDASQRRFWEPEFEGSEMNLAGWAKKVTGVPSMTVGSVSLDVELMQTLMGDEAKPTSIDRLLEMLERGDFDLVGVGRALIADPDWAIKIRQGRLDELSVYSPGSLAQLV